VDLAGAPPFGIFAERDATRAWVDKLAASKELRELVEALDTAVVPAVSPEVGDDDPFGIGWAPPSVEAVETDSVDGHISDPEAD
jgi:hypothetical protein